MKAQLTNKTRTCKTLRENFGLKKNTQISGRLERSEKKARPSVKKYISSYLDVRSFQSRAESTSIGRHRDVEIKKLSLRCITSCGMNEHKNFECASVQLRQFVLVQKLEYGALRLCSLFSHRYGLSDVQLQ